MATRLVHAPKVTSDPYGSVSPPLYQTATFEQVRLWKDVSGARRPLCTLCPGNYYKSLHANKIEVVHITGNNVKVQI